MAYDLGMAKKTEGMVGKTILYFTKGGKGNTDALLKMVHARASALGVKQVVVASTHGTTAHRAKAALAGTGIEVIAVSIAAAYEKEDWTMKDAERARLRRAGITVLTATHALSGELSDGLGVQSAQGIASQVLYRFCQGMKVAVEIVLMAADAGLLDMRKEVIAVAGTGEGADTAIVVKPAYTRTFKKLQVREILGKPREG
ncbi:MAG: hypothetical protein E4H17_03480 [Gemmatimonadales bacterium]|nr:MAG: hypothetical protein E4H17_03480 [Gemmatimonadales bacterium]